MRKGRKKFKSTFNPDRNYLEISVDEFLKSGGKITIIINVDPAESPDGGLADDFLLDQ